MENYLERCFVVSICNKLLHITQLMTRDQKLTSQGPTLYLAMLNGLTTRWQNNLSKHCTLTPPLETEEKYGLSFYFSLKAKCFKTLDFKKYSTKTEFFKERFSIWCHLFFFFYVSFSMMLGSYYSKCFRRPQTKQNFVSLLITRPKSYSHDGNIPNKNRKTSNSGEINY